MIFGIPVTAQMVLFGGVTMFLLLSFQVLVGLRIIKLGKKHFLIHKWTAFALLALAAVHGSAGFLFATGTRIG